MKVWYIMNFDNYDFAIKSFRLLIEDNRTISFRCKERPYGKFHLITVTNGHVSSELSYMEEPFARWLSNNYDSLSNLGNSGLYGVWSAKNNSFSLLFSSNNIAQARDGRKIFYDDETMSWIHNIVPNLTIVTWCSSIVSNISVGSYGGRRNNYDHINYRPDPNYYEKSRRLVMDSIRNKLYDKKRKPQIYVCILDSSSFGSNGSNEFAFEITRKGNKIKAC